MINIIFNFLLIFLPWSLRRFILNKFYKYKIHKKSRIGFSYVYPTYLELSENSKIDHFTIAVHLDKIIIGDNSKIGRGNWITGFTTKKQSKHFSHQIDNRSSALIIGKDSAITKNHHLDCTNTIQIGDFVTIAGYNSQFLTHSIDIYESRQDSKPIIIGNYCFVGTNSVVLGGSILPNYSVLGAKSLLNKIFENPYSLYAGVPAIQVKELDKGAKYFERSNGYIY